jgi:hypothetical protein
LPGSGETDVVIWGGAPVVMPRGCRLWLNLITKYRASSVICDSRIRYLGRSIIASARYYSIRCHDPIINKGLGPNLGSRTNVSISIRLNKITVIIVRDQRSNVCLFIQGPL